jgi:hypothetical protein
MKQYYRVNVPAFIAFDVVAESEEQAKRIGAAAVYTPVLPINENCNIDLPAYVCLWSAGENLSGNLDGSKVEVVDSGERSDDELKSIEETSAALAHALGNDEEFAAALQ